MRRETVELGDRRGRRLAVAQPGVRRRQRGQHQAVGAHQLVGLAAGERLAQPPAGGGRVPGEERAAAELVREPDQRVGRRVGRRGLVGRHGQRTRLGQPAALGQRVDLGDEVDARSGDGDLLGQRRVLGEGPAGLLGALLAPPGRHQRRHLGERTEGPGSRTGSGT